MPGSAVLTPGVLIDDLVPDVIDGLRGDLNPSFGLRPYRVFTVLVTWTGRTPGEGNSSIVETELTPQPKVEAFDGVRWTLDSQGLDPSGEVRLTEVSLTYIDAELSGPDMEPNQQWLIRLTDTSGCRAMEHHFVLSRPPIIDREKTMGWIVYLKHVNPPDKRP